MQNSKNYNSQMSGYLQNNNLTNLTNTTYIVEDSLESG